MRVQVISTIYIVRDSAGARTGRYRRGDVFDLTAKTAEADIAAGLLRPADAAGELPPPNHMGVPEYATQPDGTPLETVPLTSATTADTDTWVKPRTHADADAQLAELSVSAPRGATVADKVAVIEQIRAAQTDAPPATTEDLSLLSDDELIARGIECGHSETELRALVDKAGDQAHDELVLFVAEAVNRRTADPAAQQQQAAEAQE